MSPIIEAKNVFVEYRLNKHWLNVLSDISMTINALEIHGLVGESGSGKSTLALAMMRYLASNARIASGHILFDGEDLTAKNDTEMRKIWGAKMSLVPQNPLDSLNASYSIGEQIAEITRLHLRLPRAEAWTRAVEMLRRVKIADPAQVARRYPHQLSGGMQQRVTIAMALSTQPRLLVLDEPTTALDVTTQAVILDLFRDLIHNERAAALYVSHDLGTVAQLCEKVTVLYSGEIMESAPVSALYQKPLHPYTAGLLASLPRYSSGTETRLPTIEGVAPSLGERLTGCVFAARCPVMQERCIQTKPLLENTPDGRVIKCHRWQEIASGQLNLSTAIQEKNISAPPHTTYVLQARDLNKQFHESSFLHFVTRRKAQSVHAVDDVSLRIRERSTLGLVGESGSGKTTLARCIVALENVDSGTIELYDRPISPQLSARPKEVLRNLRMVFQNPNDTLNPYHTIGQALARPLRLLAGEALNEVQIQEKIAALLESVRLTADYARRYPAELSGGEKQRVAIARAFAANPALIVADEPTSSLDVSVQAVILNLLKDLRAERGASYLLISHNLDVVAYLADWIAVMYLGEIVEEGDAEDVYNVPSHPYTEALVSAMPVPDPSIIQKHIRLEGEIPSARNIPFGCRFHTRCPRKIGPICEDVLPPQRDAGDGHFIRCHIPIDELTRLQATTGS